MCVHVWAYVYVCVCVCVCFQLSGAVQANGGKGHLKRHRKGYTEKL